MGYQADCPFFPIFFFFKDVPSVFLNMHPPPTCVSSFPTSSLQTSVSRQDNTRHDERGGGMWYDSKTGWVEDGGVQGGESSAFVLK